MIIGIGTDIVEIARIRDSYDRLGDRFAKRILTDSEFERLKSFESDAIASAFLAKRFAAKEAAVKALGTGIGRGVSFQHFNVKNLESGQPILEVNDEICARFDQAITWHLSLTDEREYAQAFVILEAT
ncbi:holo-ACP synthase [Marinomonas mediterranea]|jgi:phosphopantethiene--protein transferase domain|uniref:Holo-[acyl-carrier-protein] synthase n=1 Tax=Marinomonas mediterranea (strain ATCC 700492 / JCM 21426 / NBRC 103028 / MMB-1) TaxID=717774 RepID=F2JTX1_MARM1|nr:holo-ACP synthase [Marinomonas mediterranea]ADZ90392.1 Holo-(acyl-carrier-protein) synthase [Marinomonas mediterranea MMB-1]WCN08448.1 holo-ACP synthase [Marinomonas mediterranea]WCN12502.1 holo-ACP synthase [Marinomonas mediterranea]WCN16574.1 holo-ACP synthase [Marinomonas mediterranea MMB-1]